MQKSYAFTWATTILNQELEVLPAWGRDDNHVSQLTWKDGSAFLKVGKNLQPEADRLAWLGGRLSTPELLGFKKQDDADFLLMSAVPGVNACTLAGIIGKPATTDAIADALRDLHAASLQDCPFGQAAPGHVPTHGDACLPNLLFHEDGRFSGYIDLGEFDLAPKETDLAAAVWSLHRNFGPGFGLQFLQRYGLENADETLVSALHERFEQERIEYEKNRDN